ncbi:MAG TPA: hypothetical protein VJ925_07095 [Longimicrobiales bacterium]|nr:hypothetical protein [Longimicrobiales bacterium]
MHHGDTRLRRGASRLPLSSWVTGLLVAVLAAGCVIGLPSTASGQAAAQAQPPSPPPSPPTEWVGPGAAYRTGKSMLFGLRKVEVVGITDSIGLALEPGTDGRVEIVATIDPTTFDSGNDSRDEWVQETLGGPELASLVFRSRPIDVERLRGVLVGQPLELEGTLDLPEGPRPIIFDVGIYELALQDDTAARRYLEAWARTTFDALGIEVPDVGPGGIVASPGDELELWLRLPVSSLPEPEAGVGPALSPPAARASPSRPPSSSWAPSSPRR